MKIYSKKISIFFIAFLSILLFSCKKDAEVPVTSGDFPTEVGVIFSNKCATSGCHNNASYQAAAGLNLSSYVTLFQGSSMGSPVIPFRSDFSSLCYFINTYDDLGAKNNPTMPLGGTALSHKEVEIIKNWINAGAPDKNGNIIWSGNPNRKKYYVLNQGCDVVTVFDAETNLPMRYITVGSKTGVIESPHMIKVSPDGQYWYVVFVGNNIMQKYRTSDDSFVAQATLTSNVNWNTFTISNDGKLGYCVSWEASSQIAIVNLQTMTLENYTGGLVYAHGCTLNNTNDTIYITAQTGNYIYKMDTALNNLETVIIDGTTTQNFNTSLDPHQIIFSNDGAKYFVTCQASNQVRVLKTSDNSLLQIIPTGSYPQEFAKSIALNKLYVSCENDINVNPKVKGSVTEIDMTTYQSANYSVGYLPHGIAVDEANNLLLVASRNIFTTGPMPHHTGVCGRNGFVSYFNLSNMSLLPKTIEVASDPYSISIKK